MPVHALGYCRLGRDGAGRNKQRAAIGAEAKRRGWQVEWIEDVGKPATDLKRPGIQSALDLLAAGVANALIVSRLDRLTQSAVDLAAMMELSIQQGWELIVVDFELDTGSAAGRRFAEMLGLLARYDHRAIAERTKDARRARRS